MCGARLLLAGVIVLLLAAAPAHGKPAVLDVRLGLHPGMTRIVLDLSAALDYRVFSLADPYRVVIDLSEVDWNLPADRAPPGLGVVQALRFGLFAVGTSRVVLDVNAPVRVRRVDLLTGDGAVPIRLVLDLEPVSEAVFREALQSGPIVSSPAMVAVTPPPLPLPPVKPQAPGAEARPVVAIDAGHGGVDPGALGSGGSVEKTITLAMAKELQRQLEATGRYRVILTRDTDVFVRLRDRIELARVGKADLFVSLHADAHDSGKLRGASVYTLSEQASDAEAEALAAKENKADLIAGIDLSNNDEIVTNILIDLAQRETKNMSARFADMVVKELKRETLLLRKTHRFAGFAVLKAPDVPSVLIELGYLSSREDESLLRSAKHRRKLGASIGRAIEAYFAWQESLKRS
ncbi:MAG: N-acetylmuramoyl-L-alanine amidase [Dongiaceae bacterium]